MRTLLISLALLGASAAHSEDLSAGRPMARENRLAVVLEFDFGLVSQDGFDEYATQLNTTFSSSEYDSPVSAVGAGLHFKYFAPYHIAAQVGVDALLASDTYQATVSNGVLSADTRMEYWNLLVEVPILIGGHYPVHDRIHLYGLLGPSITVLSGSYWDNPDVGVVDFEGEVGAGFQARLGADFYALEGLSLGLELMFRSVSVDLKEKKGGYQVQVGSPPKTYDGYELDFSGFGITVGFRFVI